MMRSLVRLLFLVIAFCGIAQNAHAARTVTAAVMDYGSQTNAATITAPPGALIRLDVSVLHTTGGGNSRWRSTSWRIGAGAFSCANHVNFDATGTDTVSFNLTAPGALGVFNLELIAYADDACSNQPSPTFTRNNAVTTSNADTSTVVANPTSVPADGTSASTITVTLLDSGGAPRIGKTVTLAGLSGSAAISPASASSNASGVVAFTVTDTVAEAVAFRATNVTDGITLAQTPSVTFTAAATVSRFNAVDPGGNALTGVIFTKVAGATFSLDIVALQASGAVSVTFTGVVRVQFVDGSTGGGACASMSPIGAPRDLVFTALDKGRKTLSANTVADAYRNVVVRMTSGLLPASCSGDAFANRPSSLVAVASNANRTTPGIASTLNVNTVPGAPVHNAGRPFTLRATAYNGAGAPAVTSRYDGNPTAVIGVCAGGNACTAAVGTLTLGAWSASGGTVTDNAVRYYEAGAFSLQLVDTTYAATDAGDGTPLAQRTVSSAPIVVGRFVPDAFAISAAVVTPRAGIAACAASTFSYMAERIDLAFTLTAVNAAGVRTAQYAGALARLDLTVPANLNVGAVDRPPPLPVKPVTPLTSRVVPALSSGAWINGIANVAVGISLARAPGPDGPFGRVHIGIAPADPDLVSVAAATLDLDADNDGAAERVQIGVPQDVRFGRLRLENAHGSELIPMVLPVRVQYWDGTAFVTNTADNCTPLNAANVALGNYRRNLGTGETAVTTSGVMNNGQGTLRLTPPGAANGGSVDVSVNLTNLPAGASCTAAMSSTAPTGFSYLQGAWCGPGYDRDPTARATFGVYRNSPRVIFRRENF